MKSPLRSSRPTDIEALKVLMAGPVRIHPVAGGTDLLVAGRDLPESGILVDLSALATLRGIECRGENGSGDIHIGAATTVAAIETDEALARRFAALTQAARECGSVQIRNRATIGGNIANAAPAADLVVPLALAGAWLDVIAPGGQAGKVPLESYRPGQGLVITGVVLPGAALRPASAFVKLGSRRDLTIAKLNMAAMADITAERFTDIAIMAGALGPRPVALTRAAAALEGRHPEPAVLCAFLDALSGEVDTLIRGRASHGWKRRAIRGLGLDLIALLLGRSPRDPLFDAVI